MWDIGRLNGYGKYIRVYVPEHPRTTKRGFVALHIIIMENKIDRLLGENEVVHHKDLDGHNNNIDNLELLTRAVHQALHRKLQSANALWGKLTEYKCDGCGIIFSRPYRNRDQNHKHFCSAHCRCVYAGHFTGNGAPNTAQAIV